jgi:predicted negative regulator of RcsB-dependent stress response
MASHYDLEEQEQLAQIKHFWAKYGNAITWLLIVVLGAFAAWNGWQYWQRKTALEAAVLYDQLERAAQAGDADKVGRVWSDMQAKSGSTLQAQQAGLLAAKVLYEKGRSDEARSTLKYVIDKTADEGLAAVARLRLASLELDAKAYDVALQLLDAKVPPDFEALMADRKGDVLLAKGDAEGAREAYRVAYGKFEQSQDYRRIVEAKLNALGVDVAANP